MSTAMSKAETNALSVSYEVMGTKVDLDLDFVKRYLVTGDANKITNQEIVFFMNTCKMLKLNPMVSGEVYCIKFGDKPAQLVVGKGAYMRRAFEHPDYLFKQDGITVLRGDQIFQKEGCCLYPGESLVGGWCRVYFMRNGKERTAFKEVAFSEYNKGQAMRAAVWCSAMAFCRSRPPMQPTCSGGCRSTSASAGRCGKP